MSGSDRIGRYEVLTHLASGGMGSVYLARWSGPAGFERHVVLKMIDAYANDASALAMFLDEARVIGRMHHQHIAQAYELDRDDAGRYFLVMDYIHGQTLRAVWTRTLELGLALPISFTLTVATAAASALHYAHGLKGAGGTPLHVVHRDVSLSNVMIGYDGAVKLIDFGIAKAAERSEVSRVGEVKGNAGYMAPEQITGAPIDHRADIFALGIVLYEMATMRRAFRERTDHETFERIVRGGVVPPSVLVAGFPRDLEGIIMTALAGDPAARFQDADELRRELAAYGRKHHAVLGDNAVVTVMEVLFENRDEPWHAAGTYPSEAVPEPVDDDYLTAPAEVSLLHAHSNPAAPSDEPPSDLTTTPVPKFEHTTTPVSKVEHTTTPRPKIERTVDRGARSSLMTPMETVDASRARPGRRLPAAGAGADVDEIKRALFAPPPPPRARGSSISIRRASFDLPTVPLTKAARARRARRSWWSPIAAVVMLGGAIGWRVWPDMPTSESAPSVVPMRVETVAPPPLPNTPSAPQPAIEDASATPMVQLQITTVPDDATVLLDGERLGRTPFVGEVPAEGGTHVLKLRRRGHVPQVIAVDLTADVTREIVLQPLLD